jgi:hypothetical protein
MLMCGIAQPTVSFFFVEKSLLYLFCVLVSDRLPYAHFLACLACYRAGDELASRACTTILTWNGEVKRRHPGDRH